jgi:hypothetical protein
MKIKLQDLTIDIVQQVFADVFAKNYGQVSFPNASDSTTSVRSERDLANWKQGIMNVYGNVELEFDPEAKNWWERVKVLDPKFQADKEKYVNAKMSYLDSERAAGRTSGLDEDLILEFGPDAKDEMSPSEYIQYCLEQYREYRILAADPTINDQASKLYSEKAMDYYARAQEAMDEIEPDMTDHLSDEDKSLPNKPLDEKDEELSDRDKAMVDDYEEEEANREVPRDYASMYERFEKLAGIKEEYSSTDFDTYKIGDKIELDPSYFQAFEMPDGYVGTVTNISQADYADETPVYTVKLKNIDPFGDEHEDISVEYKQVK